MEIIISKKVQENLLENRSVKIDGAGSLLIRKLGAGEGIDLSAKIRRKNEIIDELRSLDIKKLKDSDSKAKLKEYNDKLEKLMTEATDITEYEYNAYKKCIKAKSKKAQDFIDSLSLDGIRELINQVFYPQSKEVDNG